MNNLTPVYWLPAMDLAIAAPIVTILIVAFRARPRPGLGPRLDQTGTMVTCGTWNALIHRGALGGTLGAAIGRFDVDGGYLRFIREGTETPEWFLPCAHVSVHAGSGFLSPPVTIHTPTGPLRCTVSREHINRLSRNTAKEFRERRYALEFAQALVANGAGRA